MPFTLETYQKFIQEIEIMDPIIHKIVKKYGFLKPTPKRNLFALLVGSIIGQKIKFSFARKLRGKLYIKLGTDDFYPSDINNLGKDGLKNIGILKFQYEIILRIVTFLCEKNQNLIIPHDLESIRHIKGVGNWTINCTKIMYALNANDDELENYFN